MKKKRPKHPRRRELPNKPKLVLHHRWVDVSSKAAMFPDKPIFAYLDEEAEKGRKWLVKIYSEPRTNGSPWEGALRLAVWRTAAHTVTHFGDRQWAVPIHWDELQAIKDHFYPNRIAMEIYPRNKDIVNVADVRWLWVLPASADLPFQLHKGDGKA